MSSYTWHPSATQRDVWHYTSDAKRPRITLRRYSESGNVYWRAEYTSALIGTVKTPGRDSPEQALIDLRSELLLAESIAVDATDEFWRADMEVAP